jgi:non-ribosomal peptide synthetase component F
MMPDLHAVTEPSVSGHCLTIHQLLRSNVDAAGDCVAIMAAGRRSLTYAELNCQLTRVAAALNSMGLGRGDRVAIVLPNGPEMAVAFLAVASVATCAPLNPGYRAEEYDFYLRDLNATALIVQSRRFGSSSHRRTTRPPSPGALSGFRRSCWRLHTSSTDSRTSACRPLRRSRCTKRRRVGPSYLGHDVATKAGTTNSDEYLRIGAQYSCRLRSV